MHILLYPYLVAPSAGASGKIAPFEPLPPPGRFCCYSSFFLQFLVQFSVFYLIYHTVVYVCNVNASCIDFYVRFIPRQRIYILSKQHWTQKVIIFFLGQLQTKYLLIQWQCQNVVGLAGSVERAVDAAAAVVVAVVAAVAVAAAKDVAAAEVVAEAEAVVVMVGHGRHGYW